MLFSFCGEKSIKTFTLKTGKTYHVPVFIAFKYTINSLYL
ncbi:hypothetical protein SPSINT_0254 [Staphylococcus pseudintermedius HKU10-03]|nr:hypothetical protein SPSINT_0254 [Staphylococcus pseudintermedius HKU10-03]